MKNFPIRWLLPLILLLSACSATPTLIPESLATEVDPGNETTLAISPEPENAPTADAQTNVTAAPVIAEATPSSIQLPIITDANQGLVYGPDQVVIVFAEGFHPGESVSVNAMHATEGIVKSASASANGNGEIIIYHYVQHSAGDSDAYPQGEMAFRLRTSTGSVKTYTFHIDYDHAPALAPAGCGSYPVPIQRGSALVIWCGGFVKEDYAGANYQLGYSIAYAGNALLNAQADVLSDGLVLDWLTTEPGDPAGMWDITIGDQSFQLQVQE